MVDLMPTLTDSLGFLLNQAAMQLRRETEQRLVELDLSPRELGILITLAHEDSLTQRELGARLRLDRTSAVHLLNRLETAGRVVRRDDPGDGRVYRLSITPAGRRVMLKAHAAAEAVAEVFCEPLAAVDRQRLRDMLRQLVRPDG